VLIWLVFGSTWKELDQWATAYRARLLAEGRRDYRPLFVLVYAGIMLTLQEYYGGRGSFEATIRPWLTQFLSNHHAKYFTLERFEALFSLAWWISARIIGYLAPLAFWRILFPEDSIIDFGLRTKGFREHAWLYALFVLVMVPLLVIVSHQPDFGTYYPFYRDASRSWLDLGLWETLYVAQFFALEVFFRGFWLRGCRSFGMGAIFTMIVPYNMIHYGKPYLETMGALVAGTVLGSLSMKTKSIYAGFLVHITVAILMDLLALEHRHALPTHLWPDGGAVYEFKHLMTVFFVIWLFALAVVLAKGVPVGWRLLARKRQPLLA